MFEDNGGGAESGRQANDIQVEVRLCSTPLDESAASSPIRTSMKIGHLVGGIQGRCVLSAAGDLGNQNGAVQRTRFVLRCGVEKRFPRFRSVRKRDQTRPT